MRCCTRRTSNRNFLFCAAMTAPKEPKDNFFLLQSEKLSLNLSLLFCCFVVKRRLGARLLQQDSAREKSSVLTGIFLQKTKEQYK